MRTETKYHEVGELPLYIKNTLQMYVQCIKVQSVAISQGHFKSRETVYKNSKGKSNTYNFVFYSYLVIVSTVTQFLKCPWAYRNCL